MRSATSMVLGVLVLSAPAVLAATDPFQEASLQQTGTPYTPSGAGDAGAIVCRAPQSLPGGASGPKVCMHNNIWAQLTVTGKDLGPDGKTVIARPMVDNPTGEGTSDAVTCRRPQNLPTGWRLRAVGPEVCLTNGNWAKLKVDHKQIAEDGSVVDVRFTAPPYPGPMGSFGTNSISALNTNIIHER